jgi:hypothetical protein
MKTKKNPKTTKVGEGLKFYLKNKFSYPLQKKKEEMGS